MVSVKRLQPYYIKADSDYVRVVLAYQYFAVLIEDQVYQFVPLEAKEIRINRRTQRIENTEARFAFQKGKDVRYITMTKLISLPDFLVQIHALTKAYYIQPRIEHKNDSQNESVAMIISELEYLNLKRLIDKALDEENKEDFDALVKLL
ncbi:hypothetical protein [Virgibacillus alimentarius]|uniref:Uncharacterized protein YpiB (UPF0302 family) n=1 Tax=Virgibacillus alimentarius TaxID=698769 RepID=A0ABS4S7A3_9BACI|nr:MULTISPECIES: hypothetical protein [Virgibacillus]MBP2256774.1 uncharacterized protein YpiB (UPF0302 family) [Virgibacillus alimentarius]HLR65643.1 hypothetical protein [Virgibacillus sp.]